MSRTTIKPVPGYSDALSELNQVPVLTLADRVQQNIILPVLNTQVDRESSGGGSRFLRSVNGSALVNRQPVVLADLESADINLVVGAALTSWKPAVRGWWYSIDIYAASEVGMSVKIYNGLDDLIITIDYGDPIFWLPRIQGQLFLRAGGPPGEDVDVRVNQYG